MDTSKENLHIGNVAKEFEHMPPASLKAILRDKRTRDAKQGDSLI